MSEKFWICEWKYSAIPTNCFSCPVVVGMGKSSVLLFAASENFIPSPLMMCPTYSISVLRNLHFLGLIVILCFLKRINIASMLTNILLIPLLGYSQRYHGLWYSRGYQQKGIYLSFSVSTGSRSSSFAILCPWYYCPLGCCLYLHEWGCIRPDIVGTFLGFHFIINTVERLVIIRLLKRLLRGSHRFSSSWLELLGAGPLRRRGRYQNIR